MNRPVSQKQHRRKNSEPQQDMRQFREEEDFPEGNFPDQDYHNDFPDRPSGQKPSTSQTKKRNFIVQTHSRPYSAKPYAFFAFYS